VTVFRSIPRLLLIEVNKTAVGFILCAAVASCYRAFLLTTAVSCEDQLAIAASVR
jgi:hypothetical protein